MLRNLAHAGWNWVVILGSVALLLYLMMLVTLAVFCGAVVWRLVGLIERLLL
jgi:uncharacterized metal-binding protein